MAIPGSNLTFGKNKRLAREFVQNLVDEHDDSGKTLSNCGPLGRLTRAGDITDLFCTKTSGTAPQSNTANDNPGFAGAICLHYNASGVFQDIYVCSTHTTTNSFTWTKLVATTS
jgi:hypothetical protein